MAKFDVVSCEIKTVDKPLSQNNGKKYADIKLSEAGVFWNPETAHVIQMLTAEQVPLVEKAIAEKTFPPMHGEHVIVPCSAFRRKDDKGEPTGSVKTEMKVFVLFNGSGKPSVSATNEAERMIDQMFFRVPAVENAVVISAPNAAVTVE